VRVEPARLRRVLGHYPTGVVVVAAAGEDGPVGMTCNSFTSVSLDPPLVLVCPAKSSTSWPEIAAAGRFCVNVLGHRQRQLCERFAARGADRFAGIGWSPSPAGAPRLEGAICWLDCEQRDLIEAGDHWIVVGRVTALGVDEGATPLVFFRGGFEIDVADTLVEVPRD
jgi:3-hydroxy-9,10-secoandrosta-1,3,5(10)-triene-9,17-dione monooxygenase reductase component